MKRSGFTMIELIFVIVILGILAAVALPKFIGVSAQAQEGKLKAYVGSLNRTVAPALWSDSISANNLGSVKVAADGYSAKLLEQITTPVMGDTTALELTDPTLTSCSTYAAPAVAGADYTDTEVAAWGAVATTTLSNVVYTVRCMDGSGAAAPRFVLMKAGETVPLVK